MPRFLKTTETIRCDVEAGVARIALARPEQHNALSGQLISELNAALLEADARTDVNVVLLQGAGKSFCARYDLLDIYSQRSEQSSTEPAYRTFNVTVDDDCWTMEQTQRQLAIIPALHKPVIAKVHGNCLAGGTDLAFLLRYRPGCRRLPYRLPGRARQRHAPNQLLDVSLRPAMGETPAIHRRYHPRPRCRPH